MMSNILLLVLFILKTAVLLQQLPSPDNIISPDTYSPRIAHGQEAIAGQFPWHVEIYRFEEVGPLSFTCGGSIISSRWVLTAAHCVRNALRFIVFVGSIRAQAGVRIRTTEYVIHPDFNTTYIHNDIGLINLPEGSITFNESIQAIPLPLRTDYIGGGVNVSVCGWGDTEDSAETDILQFGYFTTLTRAACLENGYYEDELINSTLCVSGQTNQNVCHGDSGGALVAFHSNGSAYQVGITSYAFNSTCNSGAPSIFVRPEQYWDWITEHTGINY